MNMLSGKEAPVVWNIRVLYPGKSDTEIAEDLAQHFNRISCEFLPLPEPDEEIKLAPRNPPELYQIAAKLRSIRKPNSMVPGDIPPKLITPKIADLLAIPLQFIYTQVYQTLQWPTLWKTETVSIIPKNRAPSDKSQLRNLSCTPLFSKLLETFILDSLK